MNEAQAVFEAWNTKSGHLHSEAFAKGVLFWLKRKTGEDSGLPQFPYTAGSAEYDAWDSGLSKGWDLWQRAKATQAQVA